MTMADSERITWETCPSCGQPAAVGWSGTRPVEFDCMKGCRVAAVGAELSSVGAADEDSTA
jgi:hypothetical protein